MKVLIAHNSYQQPGGEDVVADTEARLLEENGDTVIRYERSNDELRGNGMVESIGAAGSTVWSASSYRAVRELLRKERPDIAHFHNTFPLISPSAYFACAESAVPVVQTLHNYRLICPGGQLLRAGRICEDCVGDTIAWRGVIHGCYRQNRAATAATAAMLSVHRALRTWKEKVNLYIALSEFARAKFVEGGLPAERIVVKPNFVTRQAISKQVPGEFALFVGRLSPEKGPQLLPLAWKKLQDLIPLQVVGDGPLAQPIRALLDETSKATIRMRGRCSAEEVLSLMAEARCLVVPSLWYEGFPMSIVEAFSCGLPVIASRIGSLAEIVRDGITGLHFEVGNASDLAAKVAWAWTHPGEMTQMGRNARAEFEAKYVPQRNYAMLIEVYERALTLCAEGQTNGGTHGEQTRGGNL